MSDLTTLNAVKRAAERAKARFEREKDSADGVDQDRLDIACWALDAFAHELEIEMQNPRESQR
jgi:hypothetical protein